MLKWKIAVLSLGALLATVGLRGLIGDPAKADVSPIDLNSELDDAVRRDDLAEGLKLVLEDDDPAPGPAANTRGGNSVSRSGARVGSGSAVNAGSAPASAPRMGSNTRGSASVSVGSHSVDSFSNGSYSVDSFSNGSYSVDSFSNGGTSG